MFVRSVRVWSVASARVNPSRREVLLHARVQRPREVRGPQSSLAESRCRRARPYAGRIDSAVLQRAHSAARAADRRGIAEQAAVELTDEPP